MKLAPPIQNPYILQNWCYYKRMIRRMINGAFFAHDGNRIHASPPKIHVQKKRYVIGVVIDTAMAVPPTTGVTYRLYHLSREMTRRGHCVVWILGNRNFGNRADLHQLSAVGIKIHLLPQKMFYDPECVAGILKKEKVDVVQYEITQTFMDIGLEIRKITGLPVLLEFHDIEATLRETLGRSAESPLMKFLQYAAGEYADSVIAMTPTDMRILIEGIGVQKEKLFLAPNGIENKSVKMDQLERSNNTLLFLGNLFYPPNRKGFDYLVKKILPKLDKSVTLKSVGMAPPKLKSRYANNGRIRVLGEIKNKSLFEKEVASSTIGMCMLSAGSGMKVKILDYCRFGLPIVTTTIGASGYEGIKSLLVADSISDTIKHIKCLLSNRKYAGRVGEKNRKSARALYGWPRIAKTVENAIALAMNFNMRGTDGYRPRPFWLEEKRHGQAVLKNHYIIDKHGIRKI